MRFRLTIVLGILILSFQQLRAQQGTIFLDSLTQLGICDSNGYCIPGFSNKARPKAISVFQNRTFNYDFESRLRDSDVINKSTVRRYRETEFNLRFPIVLKKYRKILGGLEFVEEKFDFEGIKDLEGRFERQLQEKSLRTYQLKLYYTESFKGNKYITGRTSFSFNGDLNRKDFKSGEFTDYFRYSLSAIYGIKRKPSKTIGFGFNAGYDFGEFAVIPVFYYNKQFTATTGIEMRLPASIVYRYYPNTKNLFYGGLQLAGNNFILDLDYFEDQKLFLSRGGVQAFMTYEREIYDFFWVSFSGGLYQNIVFNVSEQSDFIGTNDHFLESQLGLAPYIRIGLFIVPPRKLLKR